MDTVTASTTLFDDAALAPRRAARVPALCDAGIVLRVLLFVEMAVTAGAAFGSADVGAWLARAEVGAAIAVPGLLVWLIAACSARPALARLPAAARLACAGVGGGLAAWAACVPLRIVGIETSDVSSPWAIVGAGVLMAAAVYHWFELRLRTQLPLQAEAGLMELQARVRPHFLFNTLNTAIALVRIDPQRAEEVLEDLSELFRAALGAMEDESTLGDEIRLARLYLAIEGMRFGKRLEVEWDIDDAVLAARVPPLLLQPLVENAVRHGVEPNDAGGRVQIRARLKNRRAWVQVVNTVGDGRSQPGHGIGLASARERLRLMHDFNAEFHAGPTDDHRYRVRLAVPL